MKKGFAVFVVLFSLTALFFAGICPAVALGDFWVTRAPMPNSHIFLEAVTIEENIFVIGTNYSFNPNSNNLYNPQTDSWVSKAPMNLYRGNFAAAAFQGKIYVMGGFIGTSPQFIPTATAANEMYDPSTDTWTNKTSLPKAAGFLEAVTVNGKIYVMGGSAYNGTAQDIQGTNQVYDPVIDSWQSLAPMPTPVFNFAMTAVGNKIYVIGGNLNAPTYHSNKTQIYDTQTNTWSFGKPTPITTFSSAAVATTGVLASVKIYYIGGADEPTWAHTNTGPCPTQIYDPQTDSWSTGALVPTPRMSGFTLAVVTDTVYAIGGHDGVIESSVNEQYYPSDYQGAMPAHSPSNSSTPKPTTNQSPSPTLTALPTSTSAPASAYPSTSPSLIFTLTPTATVPEFLAWVILPFAIVTALVAKMKIRRKKQEN